MGHLQAHPVAGAVDLWDFARARQVGNGIEENVLMFSEVGLPLESIISMNIQSGLPIKRPAALRDPGLHLFNCIFCFGNGNCH